MKKVISDSIIIIIGVAIPCIILNVISEKSALSNWEWKTALIVCIILIILHIWDLWGEKKNEQNSR
ncbi:hypothetical protein [Leuconostoc suionicum]|uniref:hypothetical protein n=1 Tax=Leuconostoc suionicum TaxID=1511761 RepID=UPI0029555478|nr:hypothetical protein [Leuconostoc suionicum]MDV7704496.1 hypothetical protein [Leuconostoc suionicum]